MSDVFRRVRRACARVASRARHVRIDAGGLADFVRRMAEDPEPAPTVDPAHLALDDASSTLAFVVTLDAVNFGSGWFPVLAKRPGCSGYRTVATALRERFLREGPWSAAELSALDREDCARVFGQDAAGPAGELMEHFARGLRDLGALLARRFDGSFAALVGSAGGSAAALVETLAEMPLYRDVARYEGFDVPFYKRAQITVADLHTAFAGEGPGRFDDVDALTIFADNLVPHVLRRDGVLVYASDLAARIDAEQPLRAGSPEEVEIRACALHAVECCAASLREAGHPTPARRLDERLWNRGQLPEMKAHPRHRARSVYY
ncbi:MAG: queuosine salvage family protein [Myxococcota bacterium]